MADAEQLHAGGLVTMTAYKPLLEATTTDVDHDTRTQAAREYFGGRRAPGGRQLGWDDMTASERESALDSWSKRQRAALPPETKSAETPAESPPLQPQTPAIVPSPSSPTTLSPTMAKMLDSIVESVKQLMDAKIDNAVAKAYTELLALAKARSAVDADLIARQNKATTQLSAFEKRLAALERKATNG